MAWRGHRGQVDRAGQPYVWHVLRVGAMAWLLTFDAEAAVVGLLHDYLEDVIDPHSYQLERFAQRFGWCTTAEIRALSRTGWDTYQDYLERISRCDAVVQGVKLADLLDNTNPVRRCEVRGTPGEDRTAWIKSRSERYYRALGILLKQRVGLAERSIMEVK